MAIKRSKKETSITPPAASHEQKVSEQIARLELRHRELVDETARELEALKQQLNDGPDIQERLAEAQQPLLSEIATLRSSMSQSEQEKQALTQELQRLHNEYQGHYGQLQGALGSLKHVVHNQTQALDQQVRLFTFDTESAIDELLASVGSVPEPVVPVVEKTNPLPTVTDDNLEALLAEFSPQPTKTQEEPVKAAKVKRERAPRSFGRMRRFMVRSVAFALVLAISWGGFKSIQKKNLAEAGQVAGASTDKSIAGAPSGTEDPTQEYKESYAIVPFAQTVWTAYTDPDFGISIRWPQNASNELKTPGDTNLWFLRFDGYIMRFTLDSTTTTLADWWSKNSGFYTDDGAAVQGTFKGRQAWIVSPTEHTATSGTTYIVQNSLGVLQIWAKDEDPKSDDGQRLAKMMDSLTINN